MNIGIHTYRAPRGLEIWLKSPPITGLRGHQTLCKANTEYLKTGDHTLAERIPGAFETVAASVKQNGGQQRLHCLDVWDEGAGVFVGLAGQRRFLRTDWLPQESLCAPEEV